MCDVEQKKMNLESLEQELTELKETLEVKQSELDSFELDNDKYTEQFEDMLNECYPTLFNMNPSYIMATCDPTMYACELNNYVDGLDKADDEGYKELSSEVQAIQDTVDNLESQIEELKEEILEDGEEVVEEEEIVVEEDMSEVDGSEDNN